MMTCSGDETTDKRRYINAVGYLQAAHKNKLSSKYGLFGSMNV